MLWVYYTMAKEFHSNGKISQEIQQLQRHFLQQVSTWALQSLSQSLPFHSEWSHLQWRAFLCNTYSYGNREWVHYIFFVCYHRDLFQTTVQIEKRKHTKVVHNMATCMGMKWDPKQEVRGLRVVNIAKMFRINNNITTRKRKDSPKYWYTCNMENDSRRSNFPNPCSKILASRRIWPPSTRTCFILAGLIS